MFLSMFMPHIIGGGVRVRVRVYKCRTVRHPISPVYRNEKTNDAGTGPVLDQAKAVRHFLVRYRTENIMPECQCGRQFSGCRCPSYGPFKWVSMKVFGVLFIPLTWKDKNLNSLRE